MKVSNDDVETALVQLDVKESMGLDWIPSAILKLGSEDLAPSLTVIYYKCIEDCYWPSEWKTGENGSQFTRKTVLLMLITTGLLHYVLPVTKSSRSYYEGGDDWQTAKAGSQRPRQCLNS